MLLDVQLHGINYLHFAEKRRFYVSLFRKPTGIIAHPYSHNKVVTTFSRIKD